MTKLRDFLAKIIIIVAILGGLSQFAEAGHEKTPEIVVTKLNGKTFVSVVMMESRNKRIKWCDEQKACAKIGTRYEHDVYVNERKLPNGKELIQYWWLSNTGSLKISKMVRKFLVKKFLK